MTTYHLITEQELQFLKDNTFVGHCDVKECDICKAYDIVCAVQQREGPKLETWIYYKDKFGCNVYCDPEDVAEIDHDRYKPIPLYILPELPMPDEKQEPTADPIKQRTAEIASAAFVETTPGNVGTSPAGILASVERALREGAAMNERDAARYRWLRDDATTHLYVRRYRDGIAEPINGDELDSAIDAASVQP